MKDENYTAEKMMKKMTVREKIDKLHELLTDGLTLAVRINGEESNEARVEETTDTILSTIEDGLSRALDKASAVVAQLRRIEERL
jgi:hypothetical protein